MATPHAVYLPKNHFIKEESMSTKEYLELFFPCKHCSEVFVASRPSTVFCSPQCKNKHNVYKSRAKDKKE